MTEIIGRDKASELVLMIERHLEASKIPGFSRELPEREKLVEVLSRTYEPEKRTLLTPIKYKEKEGIKLYNNGGVEAHYHVGKLINNDPRSHRSVPVGVRMAGVREIFGRSTYQYIKQILADSEIVANLEGMTDGEERLEDRIHEAIEGDHDRYKTSIIGRLSIVTTNDKGIYTITQPVLVIPLWEKTQKFIDWEVKSRRYYKRVGGKDMEINQAEYESASRKERKSEETIRNITKPESES